MKVYHGIDSFQKLNRPIVTTGTFDGVHIGHRCIIQRLREIADKQQGETVLLTFDPHPRMVLYPDDNDLQLLNTLDEKIELLDQAGIDHLIILPFTMAFSRMTSVEYVRDILVNGIGTWRLVIGYDHHFGRNREGSFEHLKEFGPLYGFEVEEIPAQDIDSVKVSSTKVRKALEVGDVAAASTYLNYPYSITGKVVPGDQRGRTIGYPTANLHVSAPHKLVPADGVYAARVLHNGQQYKGMLNIGKRPSVGEHNTPSIEVNIFDFREDIYGESLTIQLHARLRNEKKFENLESLKKQLDIDKNKSLRILV